jgi:hypothetical protein
MPPTRSVDHQIPLKPDMLPPFRGIFRLSQLELRGLELQLDQLLRDGKIKPSTSPYGAPVLFVKKKDGKPWMCIDYRALRVLFSDRVLLRGSFYKMEVFGAVCCIYFTVVLGIDDKKERFRESGNYISTLAACEVLLDIIDPSSSICLQPVANDSPMDKKIQNTPV